MEVHDCIKALIADSLQERCNYCVIGKSGGVEFYYQHHEGAIIQEAVRLEASWAHKMSTTIKIS